MEWRYHHVKMVERTIGTQAGDGRLRRRVPAHDAPQAVLPRPLGRPQRALNPLAEHYSAFRVSERLLLTGHSHQAWPDVGREGQLEAWQDAAEHADLKWERAFAKAERVRDGVRAAARRPRRPGRARREHARARAPVPVRAPAAGAAQARHHGRRVPHAAAPARAAGGGGARGRPAPGPARGDARRAARRRGSRRERGARLGRALRGLADRPRACRHWRRHARTRASSCSSTRTTRSAACRSRCRASSAPGSSEAVQVPAARRATALCGCRPRRTSFGPRSRAGTRSSTSCAPTTAPARRPIRVGACATPARRTTRRATTAPRACSTSSTSRV